VTTLLPRTLRSDGDGYGHEQQTMLDRLSAFFDRYFAVA